MANTVESVHKSPPPAPTHMLINLSGLASALVVVAWLVSEPWGDELRTLGVVLVGLAFALPIAVAEVLFLKTHRNESTGLQWQKSQPHWGRCIVKLVGFYGVVAAVALVYWVLPEYHGSFYDGYFSLVWAALPYWLVLAIGYFYWVDSKMVNPKDGYWQLGRWLLGRQTCTDKIGQLLLGWVVKLFFLPLMFVYMGNNLQAIYNTDWSDIFSSFQRFFDVAFNFLYFIDLLIVAVGYVCTLRILDTHIRSTEPSFLGWAVALMCYQPFWSLFSGTYIYYDQGPSWGYWFWGMDLAYLLWGLGILALLCVYVWASLAFGLRFSNLTHRGILTNGPFRFTKHPAYVSKNLSWWMISMPFMVSASLEQTLRQCAMLLLLNGIYFLRARTEERHLAKDPVYVAYARFIEQHGLFARLGRWLPWLRFHPGQLLGAVAVGKSA
ncbi:isoprenylcysteine carboxyl methyltransferase [Simiduia sp. 21SJ11W-1]|uniref:methyltransferase family protein n=1 Tax=Simiduia sp. 21SJ11W-1 TaxID=2909669 RepID=UPI0020A101B6|nr:isoprenylcysteine carboxylmethyltransferase family protein [Simiduia sp. 21SJ11W-1]UTA46893.1 isoprenylcysteine carboxyl methyltransferase [Simiduia sp. 21SJ11W-1]